MTRHCNANTRFCADKKIDANGPNILNQTVKWAYEFFTRLFICPNVTCHAVLDVDCVKHDGSINVDVGL